MNESFANRDLVRRGYDAISEAYRDDLGRPNPASDEHVSQYSLWIDEVATDLQAGARILDLGCGNGLPAARLLIQHGFEVAGLDISTTQIERARKLLPEAEFIRADFVSWQCPPDSFDAVVCLYAFIHVPEADQRPLLRKVHSWLKPGGRLLCIIGAEDWTGEEDYMGSPMFWDHRDPATTMGWMREAGFEIEWDRFVPEGDGGHTLVMARAM